MLAMSDYFFVQFQFVQVDSQIMTLYSIQVTQTGQVKDNMVLDPRNRQLYFTYNNSVNEPRLEKTGFLPMRK